MSNVETDAGRGGSSGGKDAGLFVLFWTIFRMNLLNLARYRVDFISQFVGTYLFFAVIFFGGQAAAENVGVGIGSLGSTLDAVIVGWFLWTMAQTAYGTLATEVTQESRWGTLEQLYMSPHGFGTVMCTKVVVNTILSMLIGVLMLALMLLTTGRTIVLDALTIFPLVVLSLLTVIGLGFTFGGLSLLYKQISSVFQIMQFVLIGLIAAPAAKVSALGVLPLVQGSSMLQDAMRNGVRLWEFSTQDLAIVVGAAVVYSVVGFVIFMVCSLVARQRGIMGHY